MNKLERRYSELLAADPNVWSFYFGSVKFRLANNTWYTPDFFVILQDGTAEVHETKGYWEDDARVKWKATADLYPFPFVAVTWKDKAWAFERYKMESR